MWLNSIVEVGVGTGSGVGGLGGSGIDVGGSCGRIK